MISMTVSAARSVGGIRSSLRGGLGVSDPVSRTETETAELEKLLAAYNALLHTPEAEGYQAWSLAELALKCASRLSVALEAARQEAAAAEREVASQMQSKLDAQVTLKAVTDAIDLTFSELGNGWREAAPKILARIETIVDEADRGFRERDAAESELAGLRETVGALSEWLEPLAESLEQADCEQEDVRGDGSREGNTCLASTSDELEFPDDWCFRCYCTYCVEAALARLRGSQETT